jgi:hypothetical protein
VSIENIQDVLGHSSPTVTKTIYIDATRNTQREAIDRLDFLFDERWSLSMSLQGSTTGSRRSKTGLPEWGNRP